METTDGRDVATDVCAVPVQFVVSFHSFRDGVKTLLGAFFRSTREDVGSVCLHISSMSTFRIVSFRGEGLPVFFVRSSVRSTPTQRVLYRFNAQHFLCVQLCVDIVCRCVCLRFVLYAGHANRARIIDVHVFCAPFETNTDS